MLLPARRVWFSEGAACLRPEGKRKQKKSKDGAGPRAKPRAESTRQVRYSQELFYPTFLVFIYSVEPLVHRSIDVLVVDIDVLVTEHQRGTPRENIHWLQGLLPISMHA